MACQVNCTSKPQRLEQGSSGGKRQVHPKKGCFVDKVQVRAFTVRKAQGLQVRAAIHTGVPPQTLALREAIAQNPALLSLRDRLMAGEVPG